MTPIEKAEKIAAVLDEKKGREVKILKVLDQTVITDYFVIATATSSTHLKALCDEVEYRLREENALSPASIEGYRAEGWILMDFSDVIVHIFDGKAREFFQLEKLWSAAEEIPFIGKQD